MERMKTPSGLKWEEEAHYIHTLQNFNALVREYGAKQVLEDLRSLDPLTYDTIVLQCIATGEKKKQIAAIFRDLNAD